MRNAKLAVPSFASHDSRSRAGQAVAGTFNPVEFEFWHSLRIPGLQIIHTNHHEHAYPAHMHDALEVIWIRSGCGRLTTRNRTFDINAGEAGLVSPNEIHSACSRPGMEYVAIFIPLSLLQQIFDGFQFLMDTAGQPVPFKLVARDQATSLMPILMRTICADLPADRLAFILRPILSQMLDSAALEYGAPTGRARLHPAVFMAKSIIRDQCADRVDIINLAHRVDLDMRYLISLFKTTTGMTPHQFQIAMRVDLARCLIQQHVPLCEVAARAGFSDQSHLNRHFKRHYGFTPGAFQGSLIERQSFVV
jgi:AraC-like DNA-binding protein/mannose-6-phosphate isomerase-like protein (cupin superfamily)